MSETIDTLQDLIFVLEHSLRQPEGYLWRMPFWIAKKRYKQIMEFEKIQEEKMKENNKGKSRNESASTKRYKNRHGL